MRKVTVNMIKSYKTWFARLSITGKLIFRFLLAGAIAFLLALMGVNSVFSIIALDTLVSLIVLGVLVLAFVAVVFFSVRFFKRNIVAYISGLAIGIDTLAEGNLAYFDNDLNIDDKSKDETELQAAAFLRLVNATRQKVQDTKQIAGGDLTTWIHINSDNDLMGNALLDLVHNTNKVVRAMVTAANEVTSGADMVAQSSSALSRGAAEQADTVQELTTSLSEISGKTKLNAQNAENANNLVTNARENATVGNMQMKEMLNAMSEINQSSGNINRIIKVIEDIAFQTNILALNAAVEAARAGQHGKGFAVVAEEVRTLAAKSANAAKETTELIEGSISSVEAGSKIANSTADALERIVNEVEKAADLVSSIAAASNEQAESIEMVNQGIQRVSQVIQTNAATSEESAAASQELSSQAANMMKTSKAFKLTKYNKKKKKEYTEPIELFAEVSNVEPKLVAGKYF